MTTATKEVRNRLLEIAAEAGITDDEAGESHWAAYLDNRGLADAIIRLRPEMSDAVRGAMGSDNT